MGAFLPLLVILLAFGIFVGEQQVAAHTQPDAQAEQGVATGQAFVSYRDAVLSYVTANPGFKGNVPASVLVLPEGVSVVDLPAGVENDVTAGPNGSSIIYAWAPVAAGTVGAVVVALDGDLSIGTSTGSEWSTPSGGVMGALPMQVPAGDIVSVQEIN